MIWSWLLSRIVKIHVMKKFLWLPLVSFLYLDNVINIVFRIIVTIPIGFGTYTDTAHVDI
jgi:hypothetical protein